MRPASSAEPELELELLGDWLRAWDRAQYLAEIKKYNKNRFCHFKLLKEQKLAKFLISSQILLKTRIFGSTIRARY